MPLRDALLVAFDGTHSSGKTTLLYAVAAQLRSSGHHVTTLGEPARSSPFVDDVVIHKAGDFDILLELDLFAAHITNSVRAARQHQIILTDKSLTNVLAYCRLVLNLDPSSWDLSILNAMETFCKAWAPVYDSIFFCQDHFDPNQEGDNYRSKVAHLQEAADKAVRDEYAQMDQQLELIPAGLDLDARAKWVVDRFPKLGDTG